VFRKFALPLLTVLLAGAGSTLAPAASASAVGPDQYFTAQVNGQQSNAVIKVVCPGPAVPPGGTGAPLAGQTVSAGLLLPPAASAVGFTGSAATSIEVSLTWPSPSVTGPPPERVARFTSYGSQPIPTGIAVPCGGTGVMTFVPAPGSPTARPATVTVTFANVAV
jgi:hypothetical protein